MKSRGVYNLNRYPLNQDTDTGEYDALIKSIKRKKKVLSILTAIAILLTVALCSPTYIYILDGAVINREGIHPAFTVLIVLFILICSFVIFTIVLFPLGASMTIECNPKKHLILNAALNKSKNLDHFYATDLFYMGDFVGARQFANKMIASNKPVYVTVGLFNKARCEFFLGDFASLRLTVKQYENYVANLKNVGKKNKDVYQKFQKALDLIVSIADGDKEKTDSCRSIEAWQESVATVGFVNYLKGVAAYDIGDKKEAIYRFMTVKENCEKTVFFGMAEQHLENLK